MGRLGLVLADLLALARLLVELRSAVRAGRAETARTPRGPDAEEVGPAGTRTGAAEEGGTKTPR